MSRIAAGGPLTDDILKCELESIDQKEYKQPFTTDQMASERRVPERRVRFQPAGRGTAAGQRKLDTVLIRLAGVPDACFPTGGGGNASNAQL